MNRHEQTTRGDHLDIPWDRRMEMGSFVPHPIEIPRMETDRESIQATQRAENGGIIEMQIDEPVPAGERFEM